MWHKGQKHNGERRRGIYRSPIVNPKDIEVEFSERCSSKYSLTYQNISQIIEKVLMLTPQIDAQIQVNQKYNYIYIYIYYIIIRNQKYF